MNEFKTIKFRYKIVDKVGIGGSSTVYLARDLKTNEVVAIKILHPNYAQDKKFVQRFIREINIIMNLKHPNILKLYDYGFVDDMPYFVTEYIQGKTLKEILKEKGRLSVNEAKKIILDILNVLSYAHKNGIVAHRDIKPGNIMIDKEGNVKLMDFGIAKIEGSSLTQDTSFYTPLYASPEQIKGEKVDIRSDIYSLGATFYEMIVGKPPFTGKSALNIITKQLQEKPEPISKFIPDFDKNLENIIFKMLEKNPKDRFQTPEEIINALQTGYLDIKPKIEKDKEVIKTIKQPSLSKTNKNIYIALSTIGAIIVITILIFALTTPKSNINNFAFLTITSNPTSAEVYIDNLNNFIGYTGLNDYKIKSGKVKIIIKKDGFEDLEDEINLNPGEIKSLAYNLIPKSKYGYVNISTEPSGANIYLNDTQLNRLSPIENYKLQVGKYSYKIEKDGYEPSIGNFEIKNEEETVNLKISLSKKTQTPVQPIKKEGTLIINSEPSGATVYINNVKKGLTPLKINLPPGSYNLKIEKEDYLPYPDSIVLKENSIVEKNFPLHPIPKTSYLTVYSDPTNAQVLLNGDFIGYTPITNYKIEKGEYSLRVKKEGYKEYLTKFTVEYGQTITFSDLDIILIPEKP
ncbi:MAG: serine/threonine protein kinase [Caldisericia bacterium]|nr:serine/threonine protein kinase [Caldisericia bacterium]